MSLTVNAYDLVPGCIIRTGLRDLAVIEEVLVRESESETVVVKAWFIGRTSRDRCIVMTYHYCSDITVVGFCPWPADAEQRQTHTSLIQGSNLNR